MTEVDERIVAMHFDNKQFEKGAKETIKTLEKLKESMDMEGAAESLNEFGEAAKKLDLSDLSKNAQMFEKALSGVSKIASKTFSVATFPLGMLGKAFKGLAGDVKKWFGLDLARDIEQAAIRMTKALTIEPIGAGWNEYEMKMDSVKTIMAGTKKEFAELSDEQHMGKVKDTLEELNRYADETIYSFKDMTSSIGKFTNAGVKLDTAAKSMMGISNLAAQAGQGAQQASMAMYNFSQSMGVGYLELRDWRSIENANMATLEFKETLIDVGLAMGTLKKNSKGAITTAVKGQKKQMEVTAENLRETLQKKWATSDVLSTALEIYSGELDEKGIRALGNFTDEQVANFLKIGAEAKEAATQVRTFSKMFDALKEAAQSGWALSFEKIIGDMNEATALWTMINKRISGWMERSAEQRNGLLNQWRGLSSDGSFRFSNIDGREEMIMALENILDIVEKIGQAISGAAESVFGKLKGSQLQKWSVQFRQMTQNLSKWLGSIEDSSSHISKISKALKIILVPIKATFKLITSIGKAIWNFIMPVIDPILTFLAAVGDSMEALLEGRITDIPKIFSDAFKSLDIAKTFKDFKLGEFIKTWFNGLFSKQSLANNPLMQWFIGIFKSVGAVFDRVKEFIHWDDLKAWFREIWDEFLGFFKDEYLDIGGGFSVLQKRSGFSELFDTISEKVSGFIEKTKSWVTESSFGKWISGIKDSIVDFMTSKDGQPSQLREHLNKFATAVRNFGGRIGGFFRNLKLWDWLHEKVIQPIIDFCTSKDGQPSDLRTHLSGFATAIRNFGYRIGGFFRNLKFDAWLTEKIVQPVINFCSRKEDGSPSQLKTTFGSIVTTVSNFFTDVGKWEGWDAIWTFFNDHVITPIKKLWNWLFHGDENFEEKSGRKAGTPIGILANATASDVNLFKKETPQTQNLLQQVAESLKNSFSDITGSVSVFDDKDTNGRSVLDRISEWFIGVKTTVQGWWDTISPTLMQVGTDMSNLFITVKDAIDKVVTFIVESPWDEWFGQFNEKLRTFGTTFAILNTGTLIGGLGKAAGGTGNLLTNLGKFVKEFKGFKFDISGFEDIGKGIKEMTTSVGEGGKSFLSSAGDFFKRKDFGKQIGQIFGGFREGNTTATEKVKTFGDLLIELAGAVGVMVYAINSLLSKIEEIEKLENKDDIWARFRDIFNQIGAAIGVTEIMGLISSFGGTAKVNSVGSALIGLAVAMEGLVLAVNQLAGTVGNTRADLLSKAVDLLAQLAIIIGAFTAVQGFSSLGSHESKSGLIGFAIAIEGLVLELRQLISVVKDTKQDDISKAYDLLLQLTGLIGAFTILKNLSSLKIGNFQTGGKSSGLIGFVIAIEGLIHAVGQIANITKDENVDMAVVQGTLAEITALVTGFEVFKNLTSLKIGEFKMGGGKTGLIGFVLAIEAMIHAVRSLSELSSAKLKQGTEALDRISKFILGFEALKALSFLFGSSFGTEGGFRYKGGKGTGLIGFVLAITAMLAEVVVIGGMPQDQINNGLNVIQELSTMINKFTALSSLESFTEKFGSTGQKVAAAVSMGLFIAGLAGVLWAIAELSKTTTPDQVAGFTEVLSALWPNLATFETFIGLMAALPNGSGWLGGAKAALNVLEFIAVFSAAAYGIAKWQETNPEIFTTIETGLSGIGRLIGIFTGTVEGSHQGAALVALSSRLNEAAETAGDIDLEKLNKLNEAVGLIKTMSENLPTNPTILEKWFQGKMSLTDFAENMANLGAGLRSFYTSMTGVNFLGEQSESVIDPEMFVNAGIALESIMSVLRDYKDSGLTVTDAAGLASFLDYLADYDSGFNMSESFLDQLTQMGEAFSKGFSFKDFDMPDLDASEIVESLAVSIENAASQNRFRTAIINSVKGAISGLNGAGEAAFSFGTSAASDAVSSAAENMAEKAPEFAAGMEEYIGEMINYILPDLNLTGQTAGSEVKDGADKALDGMPSSGDNAMLGLATGINRSAYIPTDAMQNVVDRMAAIPSFAWQEHSPSRLFADHAMNTMLGLAEGIRNYSDRPIEAVRSMSQQYAEEVKIALNPLWAMINEDYTIRPVVSPVLDMNALRGGASSVNGLLGGRYSMNSIVPSFSRNTQMPEVRGPVASNAQLIDMLSERMDQLSSDIQNLKLYLDTGALVGGTVAMYDRALGFRAARSARG